MKPWIATFLFALSLAGCSGEGGPPDPEVRPQGVDGEGDAFSLESTRVVHVHDLGVLVFEQRATGPIGTEVPEAVGSIENAPVWGYVFATSLKADDVGFSAVSEEDAIVALAVTSHPDFDDTPLWDEDRNRDYDDDGTTFHSHWVVLIPDEDSNAGFSVLSTPEDDLSALPRTHPGMPMYLDSPGFSVHMEGSTLRVIVPTSRIYGDLDFMYDGLTAKMVVDASGSVPVLRVQEVMDIASDDLSLPFDVRRAEADL